ncbi:hypothetical protein [Actinomadura bangladeshensis]|uniref:Uncharacterized protein n=1 Tax=Actinomadura bangladeshensis TaxID=453573 RepID=A0A6L9QKL3_9ACTN|nr:hypothetical protein [Actinomadura bangladeshensis]NEA24574.1 hypothetical protein [Actinomadura bangladeshensis]
MTVSREPLAAREGQGRTLREGIPSSLEPSLRKWIESTADLDATEAEHALIRLDLMLPDSYRQRYQRELRQQRARQAELDAQRDARLAEIRARSSAAAETPTAALYVPRQFAAAPTSPYARFLAYGTPTEILWHVVDDLLAALCIAPPPHNAPITTLARNYGRQRRTRKITASLRRLLEESRSVYEIRPDQRGLRRRVQVTAGEAVERSGGFAEAAGRPVARHYLLQAQSKVYALQPDPGGAYADAIRAVEEVANPLLLPRDPYPTLSKARNHLRDAADKYEFAIPDRAGGPGPVTPVLEMLNALCSGHSDRHAGGPNNAPVTQESAEAAFTMAMTLVHWFSTGAIRRRPSAV